MDAVRGQLVRAKAGRDKGRTQVVLAAEGEWFTLADGRRRPLAAPKRKRGKHIALTATVLPEEQLQTDKLLRAAIAAYDAAHPI